MDLGRVATDDGGRNNTVATAGHQQLLWQPLAVITYLKALTKGSLNVMPVGIKDADRTTAQPDGESLCKFK